MYMMLFLKMRPKHIDSNNNLKYSERKKDPNNSKRINQIVVGINKID